MQRSKTPAVGIGSASRRGVHAVCAVLAVCGVVTTLASPSYGAASAASRTTDRTSGPAADISQQITGGNGPFMGSATAVGLGGSGYVQHEYVASGTATSYRAADGLANDGRWRFEPDGTARYRTRVLVRRPAKPAAFSGTVVVEWLNVSGGLDADPDYTYAYFHAAQTLEKVGRIEEAKELYRRGIEAAGRKADTHARDELQAALANLES